MYHFASSYFNVICAKNELIFKRMPKILLKFKIFVAS